jgi:hypothetical protein
MLFGKWWLIEVVYPDPENHFQTPTAYMQYWQSMQASSYITKYVLSISVIAYLTQYQRWPPPQWSHKLSACMVLLWRSGSLHNTEPWFTSINLVLEVCKHLKENTVALKNFLTKYHPRQLSKRLEPGLYHICI